MKDEARISERRRVVMRHALRILGEKDLVRQWLRASNVWLDDKPAALLTTAEGCDAVENYLSQVEYGVYV